MPHVAAAAAAQAARAAVWAAVKTIVATVAKVAIAYGTFQSLKAQRDARQAAKNVPVQGIDVPVIAPHSGAMLVYGTRPVAGHITYANSDQRGSEDVYDLYIAAVHAFREESLGGNRGVLGVYVNDTYYRLPNSTTGGGTADISNQGVFLREPWERWRNNSTLQIQHAAPRIDSRYAVGSNLGTNSNPSDLTAHFPEYNTVGKFRDYTSSIVRLTLSKDTQDQYRANVPSFRWLIAGAKCYDPRETGHSPADSSTWEHTDNPVLHALDYMVNYMKIPLSDIDIPSFTAAANDCDRTVSIGSGRLAPRWKCDAVLSLNASHGDNLAQILASCGGTLYPPLSGKWRIRVLAPPSIPNNLPAIEAKDIYSMTWNVNREPHGSFNTIAATYTPAKDAYKNLDVPKKTDANLLALHGRELDTQLQLSSITNQDQVERMMSWMLAIQGREETMQIDTHWEFAQLQPGDFVAVEDGRIYATKKVFRVLEVKLNTGKAPVSLLLRELDTTAEDDPAASVYTTVVNEAGITTTSRAPQAPINLTAEPVNETQILYSWSRWFDTDEAILYISSDNNRNNAVEYARGAIDEALVTTPIRQARYAWVKTVRDGVESLFNPNARTTNVSALPIDIFDTSDLTYSSPVWLHTSKLNIRRREWATGRRYEPNDIVVNWEPWSTAGPAAPNPGWSFSPRVPTQGMAWRCINPHTSSTSNAGFPQLHWTQYPLNVKQYFPESAYASTSDPSTIPATGSRNLIEGIFAWAAFQSPTSTLQGFRPGWLYLRSVSDIAVAQWFTRPEDERLIEFSRPVSSAGEYQPGATAVRWTGITRSDVTPRMIFCLVRHTDGSHSVQTGIIRNAYISGFANSNGPYG